MSQKIDPREVLAYLNELGYTNISAQQLKEFITDLKKLIKYENRLGTNHNEKENVNPMSKASKYGREEKCDVSSCQNRRGNFTDQTNQNECDVFNSLYNHPTVASKAKEVPRQERQISVHIIRPKSKSSKHDHCKYVENQRTYDGSQLEFVENIEVTSEGSKVEIETESTIKGITPSSKQTGTSHTSSCKTVRPKSSFIRAETSKSMKKCDPVALYHFYQNIWKKQKIPGLENHSDLRWAMREKLSGGPKVDTVSRPSSCRRSCNSWKG